MGIKTWRGAGEAKPADHHLVDVQHWYEMAASSMMAPFPSPSPSPSPTHSSTALPPALSRELRCPPNPITITTTSPLAMNEARGKMKMRSAMAMGRLGGGCEPDRKREFLHLLMPALLINCQGGSSSAPFNVHEHLNACPRSDGVGKNHPLPTIHVISRGHCSFLFFFVVSGHQTYLIELAKDTEATNFRFANRCAAHAELTLSFDFGPFSIKKNCAVVKRCSCCMSVPSVNCLCYLLYWSVELKHLITALAAFCQRKRLYIYIYRKYVRVIHFTCLVSSISHVLFTRSDIYFLNRRNE